MTFAAPLVLLALAILPALAVWYARLQKGRRQAAAVFAAPALTASVAPRRPRWRRHAPLVVMALAIAALVVAAARPQRTVAVPVEQAQIMLLNDVSGSMLATDVTPSRLVAARRAAHAFLDRVPKQVRVGVMAFNQTPSVLQSPTTDRAALTAALNRLRVSGGTATGEAIRAATQILHSAPSTAARKPPPSAIVLLSDGASTRGIDPVAAAETARRLHIPIYTVALGTPAGTIQVPRPGGGAPITRPVPPDEQSLQRIAQASGGRASQAGDAEALSTVYERLGSQLGRKKVPREITAGFAGAGLALLAVGSALSLRWFGRLI